MAGDQNYRGIFYSIEDRGSGQWKWEIKPPGCIRELHGGGGLVEEKKRDAIDRRPRKRSTARPGISPTRQQFSHKFRNLRNIA